jgi:uncharacterized protein
MERFKLIYNDILKTLESKLPPYLTYHNIEHTKYVIEKAEYIAKKEKVDKADLFLIKISALFHDIGFIDGPDEHEENGCQYAKSLLPAYNLNTDQIKIICNLILATKIPQKPKTKLENILADADLEYLSTSSFEKTAGQLFKELKYFYPELTPQKWDTIQIDFISNHNYHTKYCRHYKEFRKERNLQKLKEKNKS